MNKNIGKKGIIKFLSRYCNDLVTADSIAISAFVKINKLDIKKNILIKQCLNNKKAMKVHNNFIRLYRSYKNSFTFEDLIEIFELIIPRKDKIRTGAIYTPQYIREYIIEESLKKLHKDPRKTLCCDLSCGCGAFLFSLAKKLHIDYRKSFAEIFNENIFGCDISKHSIDRAKYILSLLAILNGEEKKKFNFNLAIQNSINYKQPSYWSATTNSEGFDIIVGNPPYVRAKNIELESKKLLRNWKTTKIGNPDLYIAFFEIGLSNLNKNGVLGYITVNTFLKSLNAKFLREYFSDNKTKFEIIDFGDEQVFAKRTTYTCICFVSRKNSPYVEYAKTRSSNIMKRKKIEFYKIPYSSLESNKWILNSPNILEALNKIENAGVPLGKKYQIRNGIATLANDIYIVKPLREEEGYYVIKSRGREYYIEKDICRDIIKPNILKQEGDIERNIEKLIYPYYENGVKENRIGITGITPKAIEEKVLKQKFPETYRYLSSVRGVLNKRDKGKGNYERWYAFGRTQALTFKGNKLLFPYIAKDPHFVFTDKEDLLFYCGYAIFADTKRELLLLKKILQSSLFWFYIRNTSKPYSSGYFALAKNYVKNFAICTLNPEEEKFLLDTKENRIIDSFLFKKYGLPFAIKEKENLKFRKEAKKKGRI